MAIYSIGKVNDSQSAFSLVINPIYEFLNGNGSKSKNEYEILNSDGTYTILRSASGDFTYDANGVPVFGTITSLEYTNAAKSTKYDEITGLSVSLVDFYSSFSFGGLVDDLATNSAAFAGSLGALEKLPVSAASNLIVYSDGAGSYVYVRGSGLAVDPSGNGIGGTVTSIELWDNPNSSGSMSDFRVMTKSLSELTQYLFSPVFPLLDLLLDGNDTIDGIVRYNYDYSLSSLIYGGDGDDVINGADQGDPYEILIGGAGNDEINGNSGINFIAGLAGDDEIDGGQYSGNAVSWLTYEFDTQFGGTTGVEIVFHTNDEYAGTAVE